MKERPIKFNADMVRALLDGRKTITRRIVKPQPQPNGGAGLHPIEPYNTSTADWNWVLAATGHGTGDPFPCPYGQPGDRLWVKEAWRGWVEINPQDKQQELGVARYTPDPQHCKRVEYSATQAPDNEPYRPNSHMPRWASRILLEIVSVRVEHLQDISEQEAISEGIEKTVHGFWSTYGHANGDGTFNPKTSFRLLWDHINGPGAWDKNPWVWVVEFKRIDAAH